MEISAALEMYLRSHLISLIYFWKKLYKNNSLWPQTFEPVYVQEKFNPMCEI